MAVDITGAVLGIVIALGVAVAVLVVVLVMYCRTRREAERVERRSHRRRKKVQFTTSTTVDSDKQELHGQTTETNDAGPVVDAFGGYQRRMYLPDIPAEVARPQLIDDYPAGPENRFVAPGYARDIPLSRTNYTQPQQRLVYVDDPQLLYRDDEDADDELAEPRWRQVINERYRQEIEEQQDAQHSHWRHAVEEVNELAHSRHFDQRLANVGQFTNIFHPVIPIHPQPGAIALPPPSALVTMLGPAALPAVPALPAAPTVPTHQPESSPAVEPEVTWTAMGSTDSNFGGVSSRAGYVAMSNVNGGYIAVGDNARSSSSSNSSSSGSGAGYVALGDLARRGATGFTFGSGGNNANYSWQPNAARTQLLQFEEQERSVASGAARRSMAAAAGSFVASAVISGAPAAAATTIGGRSTDVNQTSSGYVARAVVSASSGGGGTGQSTVAGTGGTVQVSWQTELERSTGISDGNAAAATNAYTAAAFSPGFSWQAD